MSRQNETNLNDLLQDFVNKDYDELVALAKVAFNEIYPVVRAIDTENDGFILMTSIILSAIGADGKLSVPENRFLKDVFGFDDEKIDGLLKMYNTDSEDLTDMLFDNSEPEFKASLLTFVLSVLAVDEHITREETAFLAKLFAE